jgi:hypothetical protein
MVSTDTPSGSGRVYRSGGEDTLWWRSSNASWRFRFLGRFVDNSGAMNAKYEGHIAAVAVLW